MPKPLSITTTLVSLNVEARAWPAELGKSCAAGPSNLPLRKKPTLITSNITETSQYSAMHALTSVESQVGLDSYDSTAGTGTGAVGLTSEP